MQKLPSNWKNCATVLIGAGSKPQTCFAPMLSSTKTKEQNVLAEDLTGRK